MASNDTSAEPAAAPARAEAERSEEEQDKGRRRSANEGGEQDGGSEEDQNRLNGMLQLNRGAGGADTPANRGPETPTGQRADLSARVSSSGLALTCVWLGFGQRVGYRRLGAEGAAGPWRRCRSRRTDRHQRRRCAGTMCGSKPRPQRRRTQLSCMCTRTRKDPSSSRSERGFYKMMMFVVGVLCADGGGGAGRGRAI